MKTHYAVIAHPGDLDDDDPNPAHRGQGPSLTVIAAGSEAHCWDALAAWTAEHPLTRWETAEVLARDPAVVEAERARA